VNHFNLPFYQKGEYNIMQLYIKTICVVLNPSKIFSNGVKTFDETKINKSSAVAEMGNRGHNKHGSKTGGLLCLFRGELGP